MKTVEVFVAGGMPSITYNPRNERGLESRVKQYLAEKHKLLAVTEATKSGKTVLLRKLLPPGEDTIWVDGGSINTEEDFWANVIEQLDAFPAVEEGTQESRQRGTDAGVVCPYDSNLDDGAQEPLTRRQTGS